MPIVSVNPEADPPQPRAPVRPNRAEQDGETAEEKSQEHKRSKSKVHPRDRKLLFERETEHLCIGEGGRHAAASMPREHLRVVTGQASTCDLESNCESKSPATSALLLLSIADNLIG